MNSAVGLVVALPAEARALSGGCRPWKRKNGHLYRCFSLKDGTVLVAVQSGMGMENAFSAALWLAEEGVAALGSCGVSGGLDQRLVPGDVVLADAVWLEGEEACHSIWKREGGAVEAASDHFSGPKRRNVHWGSIITVRQPVLTKAHKKSLFERTGALAVDMESAAVAQAAYEMHLPFFALRAVCDPADVSIPESLYLCVDHKGRPRFFHLIWQLFKEPSLMPHLLRMRREFAAATAGIEAQLLHLSDVCRI